MKRRSFMRMFGAAAAAPALPAMPLAAAPAAYSKAAFHAAVYHAQSRVSFSVWGLAQQIGIPVGQAETLMSDMAARGILGPIQGTTFGGRWATSNVLQQEVLALRTAEQARKLGQGSADRALKADLSKMMTHLRDMAKSHFSEDPKKTA